MFIYYVILGLIALGIYLAWYNLSAGHEATRKRQRYEAEPIDFVKDRPALSTLDVDARIPLYEDSAPASQSIDSDR